MSYLLHARTTSRSNGFNVAPGPDAGRTSLPHNGSAPDAATAPARTRPQPARQTNLDGDTLSVARAMPSLAAGRRRAAGPLLTQMGVRVSVVIPTLNEADNLPYVFARLPQGLHEVLIVDGHSTDATVAVARRLRPDVRVLTQIGRGKGNALATGFGACTGDIIVTLDADGSTDPAEIPRFVAALCAGADFVKGSRFAQGGASSDITPARRMGNHALNALVNSLYRTSFTDLCYGYNAFWARCLPYMRVDCDGFEVETLVNVRVAKAGLVIHEVPSFEHDRLSGASNLRAVRDGTRVLRTIVRERISAASWGYLIAQSRRRGVS
jgi:glycosyltransferase involved in cell wall biosynthesis